MSNHWRTIITDHDHVFPEAVPWDAEDEVRDDLRIRFDVCDLSDGRHVVFSPESNSLVAEFSNKDDALADAQRRADEAYAKYY